MRRAVKYVVGAVVVVILVAGGLLAYYVLHDTAPPKPKLSTDAPSAGGPATPVGPWHVVRQADTYVGYRIKELFGDAIIKHEVVGRTPTVSGRMTVTNDRVTQAGISADLRDLESDRAARDTYIQDNALDSDKYPIGRFMLTTPIPLPSNIKRGNAVETRAVGRLLLHGVTRPVTFSLDALWNGPTIQVVGSAPITLSDFGIDPPDTVIAKVDGKGSIELNLMFAPGAGSVSPRSPAR